MEVTDQQALPQHSALSPQHLTSLDRAVIVVIALLIALIAATILLGDRVGVQLDQVTPLGQAHSTTAITIRFNEAMNHDSATAHFQTDPALQGTFSWSGATLTFQPAQALMPGSTYTVALEAGALSDTGRELLSEYRYSFTVAHPRVAYLYPADGSPQNLWIVDPADSDHPTQITNSPTGLEDFGISPDGTQVAFTEKNSITQTSDIKLIDLQSGALQQLTNCQNALCSAPVWRPDGKTIAYERVENDPQFGNSPPRIWLIDLTTMPATTRLLFQETQLLGYQAQWSADGSRIALVDRGSAAIDIYDLTTDKIVQVASTAGTSGTLSPDGKQLVYPDLVADPTSGAMLNKMRLFTVDTGAFTTISADDQPVDDQRAVWSPDGKSVAIARQDSRSVRGIQIVLYNVATNQFKALTTDPRYSNLFFWWDPTGTQLVIQRFPELDQNMQTNPNGRPEIWTIDVASGTQTKLATNGFLPHWVP